MELVGFSEEALMKLEKEADGKWRVWTGNGWKFQLNTYLKAVQYALEFGGEYVGKAIWNEAQQCNEYVNVKRVQLNALEKRLAGYE